MVGGRTAIHAAVPLREAIHVDNIHIVYNKGEFMKGFPSNFKTKHDVEVGVQYAKDNPKYKDKMLQVLGEISGSVTYRTLSQEALEKMEEAAKAVENGEEGAEAYTPTEEDYVDAENPSAIFYRMGMTEEEMDAYVLEVESIGEE